jgi:hypothetical protein
MLHMKEIQHMKPAKYAKSWAGPSNANWSSQMVFRQHGHMGVSYTLTWQFELHRGQRTKKAGFLTL